MIKLSEKKYWLINHNIFLFFILLLGLSLRIYLSLDHFLHDWDECFHALVAKHLVNNHFKPTLYFDPVLPYSKEHWFSNHIWLHKQPLPLWLMSASISTFGNSEFAIRIPSIVFSTLAIYFTYYICKYYFGKKTALYAALFHSINGLIIELSAGRIATDHYDTLFSVFIEGAIFFSIVQLKTKSNPTSLVIGIFIGMAILTKWLPALIVLPIWFLLSKQHFGTRNLLIQFILIVFGTIAVSLPWQLYIFNRFPEEAAISYSHNLKHITQTLDERNGEWFYFFIKILVNYSELFLIAFPLFSINIFRRKAFDFNKISIIVWIFIPVLFFSFAATKMQGYILFTAPAIFIVSAYFLRLLFLSIKKTKMKLTKIIYTLLLIACFILPIRYSIERLKLFENYNRNPQWADNYKLIAKIYNNSSKKIIFLNVKRPIQFMFYSNHVAYQLSRADTEMIKKLSNYEIVVLKDISNNE